MTIYSLESLKSIIINAAREELLPRFNKVAREHKADGSIITEADYAVQHRIAEQLLAQWPETRFLGEEMTPQEQSQLLQLESPVWCLDPLDGTSNYSIGIPYYSISLALLHKGKVILGVVYDPERDECFTADESTGAQLNGEKLQIIDSGLHLSKSTAIIDFKRLPANLAQRLVKSPPYASQRSFGSVALDWCWLASGRGHVYLHGRSNIWDYAAGQYIFSKAGGYSSSLTGESVFVNNLEARSAVAAIDNKLFEEWVNYLNQN